MPDPAILLFIRRKAVWGPKRRVAANSGWVIGLTALFVALLISGFPASAVAASSHEGAQAGGQSGERGEHSKLDTQLTFSADHDNPNETTSVIVMLQPGAQLPPEYQRFARRGKLNVVNGHVVDLPNRLLRSLSAHPAVFDVHYNRPVFAHNFRTSLTVGTRAVQRVYELTGAGIGVAVIDSGIATWHDDFTNASNVSSYQFGNQRVAAFVDFVNGQPAPYDDNGHGTHVAGIIAGNGYDSDGQKAGMAPDASLISLKVLDADGHGTVGNLIAALDWVQAHRAAYNIRVVNMSVGAGISESCWTDPLTLAVKRLVDTGVVVVAAAGNLGSDTAGQPQYGGITAPGNAPWTLTVGAYSTQGTPTRLDDTMASYSSRGPTYLDWAAKPDLVAPGTGTVSAAAPESAIYATNPELLLPGSKDTAFLPYLSLSGTSMAAPVVAGTVALMLQANPSLTPNAVKAILQYTSQTYPDYDPLTQGAGFLNALGAVRLARFYATARPGDIVPIQQMWSKHIIWGNYMLSGGVLLPTANAWDTGVVWGAVQARSGANIVWGSACDGVGCNDIVWGTSGYPIVWGTSGSNIVWGAAGVRNIVWGSLSRKDIVWGSAITKNIVWGSGSNLNIVWGSAIAKNIVWGSGSNLNIVWGTDCGGANCANVVWGSPNPAGDLWGTATKGDNVVWGSKGIGNIVWGSGLKNIVWGSSTAGITWRDGGSITSGGALEGESDRLTDEDLLALIVQLETQPQRETQPAPGGVVNAGHGHSGHGRGGHDE